MNSHNSVLLIRLCFLIGAIIDAIAGIMMLFPASWASFYHIQEFVPGLVVSKALGIGASLMLGWTVLLLWAALKPVERKGVLLLTVFPVITGLILSTLEQIVTWGVSLSLQLPTLAMQLGLIVLFLFAYVNGLGVDGEKSRGVCK